MAPWLPCPRETDEAGRERPFTPDTLNTSFRPFSLSFLNLRPTACGRGGSAPRLGARRRGAGRGYGSGVPSPPDPASSPFSPEMMKQSRHTFQVHEVPGLPWEARRRSPGLDRTPSAASHWPRSRSKATWAGWRRPRPRAPLRSAARSRPQLPAISGLAPCRLRLEGPRGRAGPPHPSAVQLLELEALVAVAATLGVAEVIAGGGPAALFGGLLGSRLAPAGPRAHSLPEVLALHAELLAAAGQDVLAGGPGTLGPGGARRASRRVSALARPLNGKSRDNCWPLWSGRAPGNLV